MENSFIYSRSSSRQTRKDISRPRFAFSDSLVKEWAAAAASEQKEPRSTEAEPCSPDYPRDVSATGPLSRPAPMSSGIRTPPKPVNPKINGEAPNSYIRVTHREPALPGLRGGRQASGVDPPCPVPGPAYAPAETIDVRCRISYGKRLFMCIVMYLSLACIKY